MQLCFPLFQIDVNSAKRLLQCTKWLSHNLIPIQMLLLLLLCFLPLWRYQRNSLRPLLLRHYTISISEVRNPSKRCHFLKHDSLYPRVGLEGPHQCRLRLSLLLQCRLQPSLLLRCRPRSSLLSRCWLRPPLSPRWRLRPILLPR